MTREEEIKKEALFNCNDIAGEVDYKSTAAYEGFIRGAEWADKTMIDKACDWIKEHTMMPYDGEIECDEPLSDDYLGWCEDRLKEAERIVNEFKKAMES